MISLETISRVRLDHFKHGRSIKEIVRLRGISRNSVRKIIRSDGISEPHYGRGKQSYANRIVILQNGKIVGEHERCFGRGKAIYNPWHYVPILARKPGAIRNGAPFKELHLPWAMTKIQARLVALPNGDRQMVDILLAAHEQGLDAVEAACVQALKEGLRSCAAILNILSRQKTPPPSPKIDPPEHLRLLMPPVVDCARYDLAPPLATWEVPHGAA